MDERPNLINKIFKTTDRNKIWLGDITYIPTKKGGLYLSVFIDIFSRKVTAGQWAEKWKMPLSWWFSCTHLEESNRNTGLIVHTDQGSQYTSGNFRALLKQHGAIHSNSRKGNPL